VKFHEDDPHQVPIDDDEFFTRYFLRTSSSEGEIESYSTRLVDSVGCICGAPYNLKDKDPLHVMYMCPRPDCRRFYHGACLIEYGHWTRATHPLLRLLCSPDINELPFLPPCRSKRSRQKKTDSDTCVSDPVRFLSDAIAALSPPLPEDLLLLAAQPIVRGAALPDLSFTGNSRAVVSARRAVYAAVNKAVAFPPEWAKDVDVDVEAALVDTLLPALKLEDTGEALMLMCPNCSGPI
jgi:hypothetical protein